MNILIIDDESERAGGGNRTLVSSLGSWCSAIELHPHCGLNLTIAILIKVKILLIVLYFYLSIVWGFSLAQYS